MSKLKISARSRGRLGETRAVVNTADGRRVDLGVLDPPFENPILAFAWKKRREADIRILLGRGVRVYDKLIRLGG